MKFRNLLGCVAAVWLGATGCATKPVNQPSATQAAAPQTDALGVLAKNLRQAYPPLNSYVLTPIDQGSVRVFSTIDDGGYSCRVFALSRGRTHVGQVDASSGLSAPTLTDVRYRLDHDVKVIFSDVKKISTSPTPTPDGAGPNFPAYTDVNLLDRRGSNIDTITLAASDAAAVTKALLTLCPGSTLAN